MDPNQSIAMLHFEGLNRKPKGHAVVSHYNSTNIVIGIDLVSYVSSSDRSYTIGALLFIGCYHFTGFDNEH